VPACAVHPEDKLVIVMFVSVEVHSDATPQFDTRDPHLLHFAIVCSCATQVVACLQHATPQEVAVVQRSLADAEARAAAEEDAAAAAEAAACAAAAPWSHHANEHAFSVSSSADMSQGGFSAAGEQQQYAAYSCEQQACGQQGGMESEDLAQLNAQQIQALAGNMVGLALNGATTYQEQPQIVQQQLEQQQYIQQQHRPQQQLPTNSSQNGVMNALLQPATAAAQMQQPQMHSQEQQQPAQQQYQATYQQPAPVLTSSTAATVEGPRDVLGRPVGNTPGGIPAAPSTQPQMQPQQAVGAGLVTGVVQQPQQQQPPAVVAASPQTAAACAGAAAVAAAAAAAAGDASSQARHLTVLVHRLQSRPAVDVLAELAACASVLCKQAWQDNFSKVRGVWGRSASKHHAASFLRRTHCVSSQRRPLTRQPVARVGAGKPKSCSVMWGCVLVWSARLQVLLAGMSAVQNGSETIRELAYLLVLALAQHHSHLFEPVLEVVLQPLLQGCGDDSREVRGCCLDTDRADETVLS
jgi:chemotaxis protein histidine kinase CheA